MRLRALKSIILCIISIPSKTVRCHVTLEHVYRRTAEIELSEEDYQLLLDGDSTPIYESGAFLDMESFSPDESDYTVYNLDTDQMVVDWDD